MKNAYINVAMSAKQASRINNIAVMTQTNPGEVLAWLAFSELDGWESEPYSCMGLFRQGIREYVKRGEAPGEEIEALLRGGLGAMSLKKLIDLCEAASDPRGDSNIPAQKVLWRKIETLVEAGKRKPVAA